MTGEAKAPVLTAKRAPQHIRLFETYDACKRLYNLTRTTKPSPVSALCSQIHRFLTVAMPLFRVWVHCQRASNGLLPRRSNLLGYVRWGARSDRFLLARQSIQQLSRSQSALSHESIPQVLSCEGPRKRLPAFASGNVVDVADATGIHAVTAWHSLLFLSHSRNAIVPPYGVSTLSRERYGFILLPSK